MWLIMDFFSSVIPANHEEKNDIKRACLAYRLMKEMPQFPNLCSEFCAKTQFQTIDITKVKVWLELVKIYVENPKQTWENVFDKEVMNPHFIMERIQEDYDSYPVYPPKRDVLSWTHHCNIWDVKVVILGQDPYPDPSRANGLAFSSRQGPLSTYSLQNISDELERERLGALKTGDLTYWAKQGVLPLNTILTNCRFTRGETVINKHQYIGWKNFTTDMISWMAKNLQGIVFLLWGDDAKEYKDLILPLQEDRRHYILTATLPVDPLANNPFANTDYLFSGFDRSNYVPQGGFGFKECNHFNNTNQILKFEGKEEINWN